MSDHRFKRIIFLTIILNAVWLGMTWVMLPEFIWGNWIRSLTLINALIIFIIVFINIQYLIPKFYLKSRLKYYSLTVSILLILITGIAIGIMELLDITGTPFDEGYPKNAFFRNLQQFRNNEGLPPAGPPSYLKFVRWLPIFILSIITSTVVEVTRYARKKDQQYARLENEKLITEIKFLKAQINPHFLFNALNNIYTLTLLKSESASDYLLKLSDMLKYMVYDCSEPFVPMRKELEYLENFVSLTALKDSGGMNISLEISVSNPEQYVPPLLFIPLVENAFKHGNIEDLENGWVNIQLNDHNSQIECSVSNSVNIEDDSKDPQGGIGLDNLRKRLELLYPARHILALSFEKESYHITLTIRNS